MGLENRAEGAYPAESGITTIVYREGFEVPIRTDFSIRIEEFIRQLEENGWVKKEESGLVALRSFNVTYNLRFDQEGSPYFECQAVLTPDDPYSYIGEETLLHFE